MPHRQYRGAHDTVIIMEPWIAALIFLGMIMEISTGTKEDAIAKAIQICNPGLEINFAFKMFEISPKEETDVDVLTKPIQPAGRPTYNPLLRRLLRRLFRPSRPLILPTMDSRKPHLFTHHQLENKGFPQQLEFIIKQTVCEKSNNTSQERCAFKEKSIVKTCSAYLTEQEPMKYIVTCNNVTTEGPAEESQIEIIENITTGAESEEGSGSGGGEMMEDVHLGLSRCLSCIFGILRAP
ncbi:hypothetical protein FKM82_007294 [Ascaphus truei]